MTTAASACLDTLSGRMLARLRYPTEHPDNRGSVRETYRQSWFPDLPPIRQLTQSNSEPNTLRGMHLHRKQWDIWRFTSGDASVRLYDASSNEQAFVEGVEGVVLAIPPGISHGFYTKGGCTLLYALTEEWTGEDEFGWFPFDGLPVGRWPTEPGDLNISDRDLTAPRLADFKG